MCPFNQVLSEVKGRETWLPSFSGEVISTLESETGLRSLFINRPTINKQRMWFCSAVPAAQVLTGMTQASSSSVHEMSGQTFDTASAVYVYEQGY